MNAALQHDTAELTFL